MCSVDNHSKASYNSDLCLELCDIISKKNNFFNNCFSGICPSFLHDGVNRYNCCFQSDNCPRIIREVHQTSRKLTPGRSLRVYIVGPFYLLETLNDEIFRVFFWYTILMSFRGTSALHDVCEIIFKLNFQEWIGRR